jgi:hypothetical protein
MGVLRESGSSRLNLPRVDAPRQHDDLAAAVREAAVGDYEVLGEIGRAPHGVLAYLARELQGGSLVALRATPNLSAPGEYLLEVATRLDASIPAPPSNCPRCNTALRGWDRFCTQCGFNLWSDRAAGPRRSKQDLLDAVQQATQGKFEILGEMPRAEGDAVVYFARDLATGKVEALRVQREGAQEYSIGLTGVLKHLAGPLSTHRPDKGRG